MLGHFSSLYDTNQEEQADCEVERKDILTY